MVVDGDDLGVEDWKSFFGTHAVYYESEIIQLIQMLSLDYLLCRA
jgi:hypothetical protein